MASWNRGLQALILLAASALPTAALATDEVNVARGATQAGPGLAVRGYDVVAYFTRGQAVVGSDTWSTAFRGATYRFASQADLDAFEADPTRYVPAFGGFCAYGAARGKKFDGDPLFWKIVDGRLFLNLNGDVQTKWSQDVAANVAKADATWPQIEHRAVGDL